MDPIFMAVAKYDGQREYRGEANLPEGGASLAGAEFTVEYYDTLSYGSYGELKAAGASPARTWVLATNANGFSSLTESNKVAGDSFYHDAGGNASIPRGTVVIRETKAPEGYKVNSGFVSFQKIQENVTASAAITFNAPEVAEQVVCDGDMETVGHVERDRGFLRRRPGRHGADLELDGVERGGGLVGAGIVEVAGLLSTAPRIIENPCTPHPNTR